MKLILHLPGISNIVFLSKRGKFFLAVALLSLGLFIFEFLGVNGLIFGFFLALLTDFFLYLILKDDIKGTFHYPIFILPFLYTISFGLFYLLFPSRFFLKIIITVIYAFGLYSLFLTQNIFAISSAKTITLFRSARIVLFVLTIIILFFLLNIIFLMRFTVFLTPLYIFLSAFILSFQSLWFYSLGKSQTKQITINALFISIAISQISFILTIWPINATIYSICLTGIFYVFSGLSHSWIEGRLFEDILWEYVWVGFLSLLILIFFSNWGI